MMLVLRQYCSTSYEGFVEWLAARSTARDDPRQETTSYEGFVEWLAASSNVASWLGLGAAPHFMTLQKAAVRIGANLLHVMVGRFGCGRIRVAGMDASGFEDHHST
jgi:hypothetical protein